MVKIGVDSSGHVRNPPIWFIAVRKSVKKGQLTYGIYISEKKHKKLERSCKNWFEKISAILIYKVVTPLFYEGDAIVIDYDFQGLEKYVEWYLKKLLRAAYPRKPMMSNPNVFFIPAMYSMIVKEADLKSKRMRHKSIIPREKDPSFKKELETLG